MRREGNVLHEPHRPGDAAGRQTVLTLRQRRGPTGPMPSAPTWIVPACTAASHAVQRAASSAFDTGSVVVPVS
jgi:hypothetical protein